MTRKLQEGIYHAPKTRPGKFFVILFLRAGEGFNASQIGEAFLKLWEVYQGLKNGKIRDLPDHPVPSGDLTVLVGYGPNVFKLANVQHPLPRDLDSKNQFRSPRPTGGGSLMIGSGLQYTDDIRSNFATEEIVVQFIAETQLAVNRAVVETWKILREMTDVDTSTAPLLQTSFYSGFQREDHRSWIDFHDGLSNMKSEEREKAIVVKPRPSTEQDDQWTEGGTYLAFLRLGVDLDIWQTLDRQQQELLVGRDKLSGCPLEKLTSEGKPVGSVGCPFIGTKEVSDIEDGNLKFLEPKKVADTVIDQSHVQRANRHVDPVEDRNSLRIFRQGYEFLEPIESYPGFRAGLNFVSYQDTPERLRRILTQSKWLGSTNFGGDPVAPVPGMDSFLTVRAAGVFLVPPVIDGELFPGANIFFEAD
ncbi:peroxidase [Pseudanabaena sp. SR411]|uniref:Dyp-type peroxidase n=1 Tax=Pseudanabaena sp. SR411 TaxID=1980935 RepID=UPI000B98B387|nr:Dyp-type peroxidase domain-containing protein [Pseudanabaena sp. SR411]OYQ61664.1 peroxidase [Pseudanabaena sp. SR411]